MSFIDMFLKNSKENVKYSIVSGLLAMSILSITDFVLLVKSSVKKS